MDKIQDIELQDCPYCHGTGLLEEENGWCMSVTCLDCGSQTASFPFNTPEEKVEAARKAAMVWNMGKVIKSNLSE